MIVADSHEFIELYRGDKDIRLGIEFVRLRPDMRFVSFAPRSVSPVERALVGSTRLDADNLPVLPERMDVRLLPSAAIRFAHKEVGGVLSYMPGYAHELRRLRPDVIIENPYTWLTPRSYSTDRVARKLGIPVVYYDPGDDVAVSLRQRVLRPFERPVINRAAAIITYNEVGRQRFIRKYGYPSERIHVIPKPVDVSRWHQPGLREEARRALGIGPGQFVVAHTGRLTRFRGSVVLADVAKRALGDARFNDTTFLFVGGALGSALGTSDFEQSNTIVTGMVENTRVPALLAAADVVVFPDLGSHAGFTTAIAEAMAAARPLVVGLHPEQGAVPLTHDVDCVMVEPGSATDILEALADLKGDHAKREALGERVGLFAAQHMDYSSVARAYLEILEGLVRQ